MWLRLETVGFSQHPPWCFDTKNPTASTGCRLPSRKEGQAGWGGLWWAWCLGRKEAWQLVVAPSGQGPAVGFARLATRLLQPQSFLGQATHRWPCRWAAGQVPSAPGTPTSWPWRGHGLPSREASPPMSGVGFEEPGVVGDGFPRKRTAALLVFVGWQEAFWWGLRETGPWSPSA